MAYQEYQNSQNWPEDTKFCFQPEQVVNPIQTGKEELICDYYDKYTKKWQPPLK